MGLFQDLWNKGIKKLVKAIAQGLTDENKESDVKELGLPIFLEGEIETDSPHIELARDLTLEETINAAKKILKMELTGVEGTIIATKEGVKFVENAPIIENLPAVVFKISVKYVSVAPPLAL